MEKAKSAQEKIESIATAQSEVGGYGSTITGAGQSRRHFLKVAGTAAAIGAGLGVLPLGTANLFAAAGATDWVIQSGFPASGIYLSPVQKVDGAYTAIGSYWEVNSGDGNKLELQIRTSRNGTNFSDWYDIHPDTFESKTGPNQPRFFGRVQFLAGVFVQFQLNIPAGMSVKLVGLTFIDTSAGPASPDMPASVPPPPPGSPPPKPPIITRSQWGANESLRFSGGGEVWPREYQAPKAMIVHHSETPNNNNPNPAAEVRSIYYYHAVTKGWGDIGYNYLIDWKGNVYEGRYGGEDVIGGHAYPFNPGTIGICMIGSFKTSSPPAALTNSLVQLLAWGAYTKRINPNARIFMIDRTINTISGHRDVNDTTCPGDAGYSTLPAVRQRVSDIVGGLVQTGTYNVDLQSIKFSPTRLKPGELLKIEAVVKNTGTLPLESQEPGPGYIYEDAQSWDTQNFEKITGKFRLAVDFSGNTGISHPYRWGLGKTVAPGETVTVTGFVRVRNPRKISMYGGVIQEYFKYFEDNVGPTGIEIVYDGPKPTDPAAPRNSDPNIIYFKETGHNLGYSFRRYWEQNGGLEVFGFPLTEEFVEDSPSEPGKRFTVQYFQRNRFEYHPENRGTKYEVLLGLLGVQLNGDRDFPKTGPVPNTPDRVFFPETGHTLGGSFYQYWRNNGGLALFGYPISQEFLERNPDDGKTYTVQYFERNRFEYHPENKGTKYEVLLGLLGTELCRRKGWL